ncbi:MAG: hypothetical protein IKR76_03680 [Ruminococcus sp.]|nr:hypothetical protein [Ruminococcus sp.]
MSKLKKSAKNSINAECALYICKGCMNRAADGHQKWCRSKLVPECRSCFYYDQKTGECRNIAAGSAVKRE